MSDIFGAISSRQNVEQAYIALVRTWLETYLSEIERQNGLQPLSLARMPDETSVYGSVDGGAWREDMLPVVIVTADPFQEPIRLGSSVQQWFEVKLTSIVVSDDEDDARALADWYGTSVFSLAENDLTNLGGLSSSTLPTGNPPAQLVPDESETRTFAQSVVTFQSLIRIMATGMGPLAPIPDGQQPPDVNTVQVTNLTFDALPETDSPS